MKTHTQNFKNSIIKFGRELDSIITYESDGETIELSSEQLNSVNPHYEGEILKSVMKQLDVDSNVEIPKDTVINYQFGLKVGDYEQTEDETYQASKTYYSLIDGEYVMLIEGTDYDVGDEITGTVYEYIEDYEYIDFGNYIVDKVEKQEDLESYKITCYDKMLYSMKDYENIGVTYPITIRNYINAICTHLGLTFKNSNSTFANYDKEIQNELYLDTDGNTLGYTFRDVLDELAQVTASTICINEVDDELEIRYINTTNDTIDEEYLKDVNVNFGKIYGPVNTIVLSRSAESDNIYYPTILPENPVEIKISENQIMNFNDRDTYLPDIYNQLNGLQFYVNDFASTGIGYYNLCDRYNVSIDSNTYSCVMFNDNFNVTQGLEETIYTDIPASAETEYKYADTTDRKINKTTLIVDKQNQVIEGVVEQIGDRSSKTTTLTEDIDGITTTISNTGGTNLFYNTGLYFKDDKDNFTYWETTPNYEYEQTLDTEYKADKKYYSLVSNNYVLLVEGVDYTVGDEITGTVYEVSFEGYLSVVNDSESLSGTNMVLPSGKAKQTINITPGTYSLSFSYRKNIPSATATVNVANQTYTLGNSSDWQTISEQLEITTTSITIEFICDVQGGYYIKELMLNNGAENAIYTQNINETRTDTVKISAGIEVSSSSTNTISRHDSDGFRILRKDSNEVVLRATENGTETKSIKSYEDSEIAGLVIKKYDGHVFVSGKGDE